MGKHTRFDSSDDEEKNPREEEREHKHRKEEKKHREEKKDRDRSPRNDKPRDERDRRGSTHERRDRDRDDYRKRDRDRGDRRNDYDRRDRDRNREQDKGRLSQEEIKAQRKALWGNKTKPTDEASQSTSESSSSAPVVAKNEKLWSSAIAATGVDQSQASKFMRLMGVKNAPKPSDEDAKSGGERERQTKLLSDLERQYAIARETTHMGKGNGLGFH